MKACNWWCIRLTCSTAFPFRPWGFARRFRRMAPRSPSTSWRARRHQIACSVFCGAGHGGPVKNFFGFDSPAIIGIEFRYGLLPGTQVGFYRSNTRHIQLFARQNILWQRGPRGIGLDIQASLEGLDNLSDDHGGSVQAILSKRLGNRASVYIEPTFVSNVNNALFFHPAPPELDDDDDGNEDATFMVGLGARLRVRPTVYLVGEFVPRVGGFDDGAHYMSFGIEKRAGARFS